MRKKKPSTNLVLNGSLIDDMNLFISKEEKINPLKAAFNMLLLSAFVIILFWLALSRIGVTFDFSFVENYKIRLWNGFKMTVYISICSLILSLLIGVLSAVAQSSKILMLRYLAKGYVAFIRGTPLIMQIYLFFYIVGTALNINDRFVCGVIILSVFEGAYISEIIRGSLLSQDQTQIEAAKAVGFTNKQTIRFVIVPQLFARTLPALTGQFASIIKDSSLLCMISLIEITQTIREITAENFKMFECYLVLGLLYLLLTLPISFFSKRLERKFAYENRT